MFLHSRYLLIKACGVRMFGGAVYLFYSGDSMTDLLNNPSEDEKNAAWLIGVGTVLVTLPD